MAHLNCQSMANKIDLLRVHLQTSDFQVVTLSETWLNDTHPPYLYNIENYNFNRLDRAKLLGLVR